MRLFIAIRFDEEIINALTDLQECLKDCGLRGKCSPPEKLHLTLAFIGEYGSPDAVMDALTSVPFSSFPLRLDGLGNFGDLYWAGIADNPQLFGYVKRLRRALADHEIPFDRKRFSPHITLIRKATFYGETPLPDVQPPTVETQVRSVSLMRSDRGKHGMIYTELGQVGEGI